MPMRKEAKHVTISPEHDSHPRESVSEPRPGNAKSWRDAPRIGVTSHVLGWVLLGAVLPICFGLLLGAAWATQALQPKLWRQAEERRRLNEEWVAIRAARRRRIECPRCGIPLYWYVAPTDD